MKNRIHHILSAIRSTSLTEVKVRYSYSLWLVVGVYSTGKGHYICVYVFGRNEGTLGSQPQDSTDVQ